MYDLPKDILTNLVRKEGDGPTSPRDDETATDHPTESRPESRAESSDGSKSCSLCGVTFNTIDDQRSHIRSDFHGYNLKQRMRGANAVTENEFEKLVGGRLRVWLFYAIAEMSQILMRVFRVLILRSRRKRRVRARRLHSAHC